MSWDDPPPGAKPERRRGCMGRMDDASGGGEYGENVTVTLEQMEGLGRGDWSGELRRGASHADDSDEEPHEEEGGPSEEARMEEIINVDAESVELRDPRRTAASPIGPYCNHSPPEPQTGGGIYG